MPIDNAALREHAECTRGKVPLSDWPVASGYRRDPAPVDAGEVMVWDVVEVNNGGHYDPERGVFTTPVAGIYELCASIRQTSRPRAQARLRVDGEFIGPRRLEAHHDRDLSAAMCLTFAVWAGAEVELVSVHDRPHCKEAACFFTMKLIAPACPQE